MLSVTTNLASLIVQSNLRKSTNGLNAAIERMTTGFKINGAKDNAANHSIVTDMSTKISAYEVAEENVSMGLDMVSTASDMLDQINDRLARLRALQEQAANGTYGEESLKAINKEVNALVDEIERLYDTTEYNGIKLFGKEEPHGFIQEVTRIDTSAMTTLASVDENTTISGGTYSISTAEELAKLATMTNTGKVSGGTFVLANDIDLSAYSSGEGWTPIGKAEFKFSGIFEGNGYVIKNLYINRPTASYQGLFGYVGQYCIRSVGLENVNVTGDSSVGGLAGAADSTALIINSYVTGAVTGDDFVGGLVGLNSAKIENSYAMCAVTGNRHAGGLTCVNYGGVTNSYAAGSVVGDYAGGLIGINYTSVANSYAMCAVAGNRYAGGLVQETRGGRVTDSYYDKEKSGQSDTGKGVGISTAEIKAKMIEAGLIKPDDDENWIIFQVGINSNPESQISINTSFALSNLAGLRNIGLGGNYLNQLDELLSKVNSKQVEYGAVQNRLESVLEEINIQYENLVSSRSTLRDADVAEESSAYIRNQILQEAAATLLATANQSPAIALQLL